MTDLEPEQETRKLLRLVTEAGVEHIIVGGVAANAWGGSELTQDLDLVIPFDVACITRLMEALAPHRPRHWTRPDLGVIREPPEYLATFRMLLLLTDLGHIDLLRTCEPVGDYDRLHAHAGRIEIDGISHELIDIDDLIAIKDFVGRPKDVVTAAQLRAIRSRLPPR
jgi:predicted nucleotidyltransferase